MFDQTQNEVLNLGLFFSFPQWKGELEKEYVHRHWEESKVYVPLPSF